jgi:hypothetical protein
MIGLVADPFGAPIINNFENQSLDDFKSFRVAFKKSATLNSDDSYKLDYFS